MVLQNLSPDLQNNLIHHSDRGVQYCHHKYIKLLKDNNIQISMTDNGDPLENAIAERLNGIIKEEYLIDKKIQNIDEARDILRQSVILYNEDRPHNSISNKVPSEVHDNKSIETKRLWKNYYKKRDVATDGEASNSNCEVERSGTEQLELENIT